MLYVPDTIMSAFQELLDDAITPAQCVSWLLSHYKVIDPGPRTRFEISDTVISQVEDVLLGQTTVGEAVERLNRLGIR